MGISKQKEKAKIIVRTKSKYLPMSVMTITPSGAVLVKNPNTNGKTIK
jgi:hypothetical protein|tara:strand:+ start:375 stop:518 length:144 start_codon:yes stop_codon:yes gene_type:complete